MSFTWQIEVVSWILEDMKKNFNNKYRTSSGKLVQSIVES